MSDLKENLGKAFRKERSILTKKGSFKKKDSRFRSIGLPKYKHQSYLKGKYSTRFLRLLSLEKSVPAGKTATFSPPQSSWCIFRH